MFDAKQLFKERLSEHLQRLNRHLRYIFNGHFMIALMFIIVALAVYYQQALENIPSWFPGGFVIAAVLGIAVSYNPLQTFLKAPDQVFLMVKEVEMAAYFLRALLYNFVFQLYIVAIALAVVGPLYGKVFSGKMTVSFVSIIVLTLLLKVCNLYMQWAMMQTRNKMVKRIDKTLRLLLSVFIIFALVEQWYVFIPVLLYLVLLGSNYVFLKKHTGLLWDELIENDRHRLAVFYRFASMFKDVPQLPKRIKKRRLLSKWVERITPLQHKATFDYLFRLTFIRTNDYIALYVRLVVIGAIILYFIPNMWVELGLALLFLYMSSFQLIPLFSHHQTLIWMDLYPVEKADQQASFLKGSKQLGFIQTIIFTAVFLIEVDWIGAILIFVLGMLFIYVFHQFYVQKKIQV